VVSAAGGWLCGGALLLLLMADGRGVGVRGGVEQSKSSWIMGGVGEAGIRARGCG
jgi:hypothetical protein